jgi:hypothetical protein
MAQHLRSPFIMACGDALSGRDRDVPIQGGVSITSAPRQVDARLIYLAPTDNKPFAHTFDPGPGQRRRSGEDVTHQVTIRNARLFSAELSLDKQGFELVTFPIGGVDFYDDEQVKSLYYREVERLLREFLGATRVVISNHTVRSAEGVKHGKVRVLEPVLRVHNDYTTNSAPQRVCELLPSDTERLLRHRFAAINVWRATNGPVKQLPLALCDAESVQPRDLVANDLIFPGRRSETYKVTYNSSHRWHYFPDMQPDEAILIKCYDSDEGRARFTPHAAFQDPTAASDSPLRESIEVRAFAFFGPENAAT